MTSTQPKTKFICVPSRDSNEIIVELLFLLESPPSDRHVDRHVALLYRYLSKISYTGCNLKEAGLIGKVIWNIGNKVQDKPKYATPYYLLIKTFGSIDLNTLSDYLDPLPLKDALTYLSQTAIDSKDEKTKYLVLDAISNIFKTMFIPKSDKFLLEAIKQSQLIVNVIAIFNDPTTPDDFMGVLLDICLILVRLSIDICIQMTREGTVSSILKRLFRPCPCTDKITDDISAVGEDSEEIHIHRPVLQYAEEITTVLIYMLKYVRNLTDDDLDPPDDDAMRCLRYAIKIKMNEESQKGLRNDLVGLALEILGCFKKVHVFEIQLAADLVNYCAMDSFTKNKLEITVSNSNEDLVLREWLFVMMCYFLKFPFEYQKLIITSKVVPVMLRMIKTTLELDEMENIKPSPWSQKQNLELTLHALNTMSLIVPFVNREFVSTGGYTRLVKIINDYVICPKFTDILYACLKTLTSVVISEDPILLSGFIQYSGIERMIILSKYFLDQASLTTRHHRILTRIFYIITAGIKLSPKEAMNTERRLSLIEKLNLKKKFSFSIKNKVIQEMEDSIYDVIFTCIKRILSPLEKDLLLNDRLLISIADLFWEAIVLGSKYIQKRFIMSNGIYHLLDILQATKSVGVKSVFLGALVDFCEIGDDLNSIILPHLISWRGGSKRNYVLKSLLSDIFYQEEIITGVKRTKDACIEDVELPLMGEKQFELTFNPDKTPDSSPATMEMLGSVRPKVYALFMYLDLKFSDQLELANESYRLYDTPLLPKDQVILLVAKNYFALKMCEVWSEIRKDLERNGVIPTDDDAKKIFSMLEKQKLWSGQIKDAQEEILKGANYKERLSEHDLYDQLKQVQLTSALQGLKEMLLMLRTCDSNFRTRCRTKMLKDIDSSTPFPSGIREKFLHKNFMRNINVTEVFNLMLFFPSENRQYIKK